MSRFIRAFVAAAALLTSATASAEGLPEAILPSDIAVHGPEPREAWVPGGMAVTVGGGVVDFLRSDARSLANVGGTWDVRARFATRYVISAEIAYIGSLQATSASGLDPSALLMSNGLEGVGRINILAGAVQPYGLIGFGYRHYDVIRSSYNTSVIQNRDGVFHVPMGGGVTFRLWRFVLDLRVTFRPTFSANLMGPMVDLSTVSGDALFGFEL